MKFSLIFPPSDVADKWSSSVKWNPTCTLNRSFWNWKPYSATFYVYVGRSYDLNYKSPNTLIFGKETTVDVKTETTITDDFILVECVSKSGSHMYHCNSKYLRQSGTLVLKICLADTVAYSIFQFRCLLFSRSYSVQIFT